MNYVDHQPRNLLLFYFGDEGQAKFLLGAANPDSRYNWCNYI